MHVKIYPTNVEGKVYACEHGSAYTFRLPIPRRVFQQLLKQDTPALVEFNDCQRFVWTVLEPEGCEDVPDNFEERMCRNYRNDKKTHRFEICNRVPLTQRQIKELAETRKTLIPGLYEKRSLDHLYGFLQSERQTWKDGFRVWPPQGDYLAEKQEEEFLENWARNFRPTLRRGNWVQCRLEVLIADVMPTRHQSTRQPTERSWTIADLQKDLKVLERLIERYNDH